MFKFEIWFSAKRPFFGSLQKRLLDLIFSVQHSLVSLSQQPQHKRNDKRPKQSYHLELWKPRIKERQKIAKLQI